MDHVTAQEAHRLVEDEHAIIVDCRERYEWDEMRIDGARLVPLSEYEGNPELVAEADKVIFQCATGHRSQTACAIYEEAHPGAEGLNLQGGITAWAANGFPIQIGPPAV